MLGAVVPDIDCVLMPAGWDIYLRGHQVGTHSVLGVCVLGALVGVAVQRLTRAASGDRSWDRRTLVAWATVAACSHLLLDLLSGAQLALAWPISTRMYPVPLVAMADPWLMGLFTVGAVGMWKARARPRRAAISVVVAATLFFSVKAVLYGRIVGAIATDARFEFNAPRAIAARWGSLTDWDVFERDRDVLRTWRVNAMSGAVSPVLSWATDPETPLVARSRSLPTVQNFLAAHALGFAVERPAERGRVEVLWSDARYCWIRGSGTDLECALWFGGVFDPGGRPFMQVVHLRGWRQTRPASP